MEKVKEQDLILYLAREDMDGSDIDKSDTFDIYKNLLHGKEREYETYEKCWKHLDMPSSYRANTILLCPNRMCDDSSKWGPTVKFMDYRFGKGLDDGRTVMAEATFLVGLNYWLLVQAGTDAIPLDRDLLSGAFSWDVAKQELVVNNAKHFNPAKFTVLPNCQ